MTRPLDKPNSCRSLWLGVGLLFALLALAWTAMFFFASRHRAAEVPLATTADR